MRQIAPLDNGKAQPLVFTFTGELLKDGDYGAPEPDFLKWLETSLFVDVAIAGDTVEYDKLAKDEREAWKLFYGAVQATGYLFDLYRENLPLFQKVAQQLTFLPCFLSRHPDNQRFNRDLLGNSKLSQVNMASTCQPKGPHLARQSWPVRYAYAIMAAIDLSLDTYGEDLPIWAEIYGYGVKHPIPLSQYEVTAKKMGWDQAKIRQELLKYHGHYRILPSWTKSLETLRRPFNKNHVLDYWHTGKEMILEEMPEFHLRPEWQKYRENRTYRDGAKTGAIQHAIFKDILTALKTIAGSNHKLGRPVSKSVT